MHEQEDNGKQWMRNGNTFGVFVSENDIGDGEWHTVGYRWEKDLLIAYLDGREIFRQAWGPNGGNPPFDIPAGEFRDNAMMQMDNQLNILKCVVG